MAHTTCSFCAYSSAKLSEVRIHEETCQSNPDPKPPKHHCQFDCGSSTPRLSIARKHEKSCKMNPKNLESLVSTAKPHHCQFGCNSSFSLLQNCRRHEARCKRNPKPASAAWRCRYRCTYSAHHKQDVQKHQKTCKFNPRRKRRCICNQFFRSSLALGIHRLQCLPSIKRKSFNSQKEATASKKANRDVYQLFMQQVALKTAKASTQDFEARQEHEKSRLAAAEADARQRDGERGRTLYHLQQQDYLDIHGHRYEQTAVIGDGNCLFRAAAANIFASERHWRHVQKRVRFLIRVSCGPDHDDNGNANPPQNCPSSDSESGGTGDLLIAPLRREVYNHLNQQTAGIGGSMFEAAEQSAVWATEETVQVIADAFNMEIVIRIPFVDEAGAVTWATRVRGLADSPHQIHLVLYPAAHHWQALRLADSVRIDTGQSPRSPFEPLTRPPEAFHTPTRYPPFPPIDIVARRQFEARIYDLGMSDVPGMSDVLDRSDDASAPGACLPDDLSADTPKIRVASRTTSGGKSAHVTDGSNDVPVFLETHNEGDTGQIAPTLHPRQLPNVESSLRRAIVTTPYAEVPSPGLSTDIRVVRFLQFGSRIVNINTGREDEGLVNQERRAAFTNECIAQVLNERSGLPIDESIKTDATSRPPVYICLGRFSQERTVAEVLRQLQSHPAVLADYIAWKTLAAVAGQCLPVAAPQQAHYIWVNNRCALSPVPMKDTPFVIPELLQLITILDELAGLGPLAPKVVFLIRSISGLSVYRQVWKNIRQTYPDLDISIVFALRYNFVLDVKPRFPDFELVDPFFRVPQPAGLVQSSPAHMYYSNPLSIDDLAAAERESPTATPAAKVIEQLFTEEWDARAAMMYWDDATAGVFARDRDRNGFQ